MYSSLVADEELTTTISSKTLQQQKEEDIEKIQLIKDLQDTFEQKRRSHGSILISDLDDNDSNENDSDIDLPYISDEESNPYYNEYQSNKKTHGSGPVKLYLKETLSNWPKDRYNKYRKYHLEKHGIPMSYGSIHTKEIKDSLKYEKSQRKKDEYLCNQFNDSTEDITENTVYLSITPEYSRESRHRDRISEKTIENDEKSKRSPSKLRAMKDKVKKTLKRNTKYPAHLTVPQQHIQLSSDAE